MYLIDTNVISEIRKRSGAHPGVQEFFNHAAKEQIKLYLSVITIGELRRGVDLMRHRGDVEQAARLEEWLDTLLKSFANHILTVGDDVAQTWGRLRVPHAEHALDKLIAATALIYNLTVVTRNTDDFVGTGARVVNPFDA
ncbi:type II toxin-antitoxin system VapC family toxin [Paraburkholderia humisilvae]|uniref:type II toxin-antitoxin system VapC family toxin n=1 Tax=Paraburkholderia humisilvae TaxID=627669 RepID=UPI001583BA05|nr:type II toxin-antitoxin system VapC family toxin [Paraburkholderia humisilvae]